MRFLSRILLPFAWIFDLVTSLRNMLYDRGIIRSHTYVFPIICIGNLSVGGTGKTPHTEYLIRLLQGHGYKVAVLSRGYRRKTKGFVLADGHSTAADIGDEPLQMYRKFKNLTVAVDADRHEGISILMHQKERPDVILLDDAFQHRKVKAGLNILLTDIKRPYCNDSLMPSGRLRENKRGSKRADVVIVTKCQDNAVNPRTATNIYLNLNIQDCQELFFSRMKYGQLSNGLELSLLKDYAVLLVTGIANPHPLEDELRKHTQFKSIHYPDHHSFSNTDIRHIEQEFHSLEGNRKLILTTEKDFTRLSSRLNSSLSLCSIPIEIEILNDENEIFNQIILDYVRKDSGNS